MRLSNEVWGPSETKTQRKAKLNIFSNRFTEAWTARRGREWRLELANCGELRFLPVTLCPLRVEMLFLWSKGEAVTWASCEQLQGDSCQPAVSSWCHGAIFWKLMSRLWYVQPWTLVPPDILTVGPWAEGIPPESRRKDQNWNIFWRDHRHNI